MDAIFFCVYAATAAPEMKRSGIEGDTAVMHTTVFVRKRKVAKQRVG